MTAKSAIFFPPFHIELIDERLWRGTQTITLRPKTFAVLRYLLEHPNSLVTKDELLDAIWPGTYVSEALIKNSILELRKALEDNPRASRFIETVHRRGYRFIGEVVSSQHSVVSSSTLSAQSSVLSCQHSVLVGRESEITQSQIP